MDIFSLFTLFGGLALFLFGMSVMSSGLEKAAGGRLESILSKMTSSRFKGMTLGAAVTAVIQSSSAVTVILVGLVNSGIISLRQSIGVIMGSNIGTTVTAWLFSLIQIDSGNVIVKMLKPENFAPLFAILGILFIMVFKNGKKKNAGNIMIGFAILMYGMTLMSGAVKPLADVPEFTNFMLMFKNPILGVLVGALITAVIQSSSASVGILQALSVTNGLTFGISIPIIMGQNIGTCITSIISSIGANKNAKRVAAVHLFFNLIGTVIFLVLFYALNAIIGFGFLNNIVQPSDIAIIHTIFNVATTIILIPFVGLLEKLAFLVIRDKEPGEKPDTTEIPLIDERLLRTPSFAIAECRKVTATMAQIAKSTLLDSIGLMDSYDERIAESVLRDEDETDYYEDKLGSYLVKLSSASLSQADSQEITKLLHCIGDIERIGDHAVNIKTIAEEIHTKKIVFTDDAKQELKTMIDALSEIIELTTDALVTNSTELAMKVEPLEQVIDSLRTEMKRRHISRLQGGRCTIEMGFIYTDFISNCERVSDHCSNIAVCVLQMKMSNFDTHFYLNDLKENQPYFQEQYIIFKEKYILPAEERKTI